MKRHSQSIGSWIAVPLVLAAIGAAPAKAEIGIGGRSVPRSAVEVASAPARDPISSPLWQDAIQGSPLASDTVVTQAGIYTPVAFSVAGADSSLGGVFNELGAYNPAFWRLFHWEPTAGIYAEGPSPIRRGQGYWLITGTASSVAYSGSTAAVDTFRIPLGRGPGNSPGWNHVANPYPYSINSLGLVVTKRDSTRQLSSGANTFTQPQVKVWNPPTSAYINGGTIAPRTPFWVRVTDPDAAPAWTRWQVFGNTVLALDLAIDSHDVPRLMLCVPGLIQLAYRPWENRPNAWGVQYNQAPANDVQTISVKLDAADRPHIAHAGNVSDLDGLAYSFDLAVPEHVTTNYSDGVYSSLALNAQGFPRIAYGGSDYSYLRFAFRNANSGPWSVELADNWWAFGSSLQVDGNGVAHVAYVARDSVTFDNVLRYASRTAAGVWTRQGIEPDVGFGVSLALDPQGSPHICYVGADGELTYASRSGTAWVSEKIGLGTLGRRPSMTFDAQGQAHVSYNASSDNTLRHAFRGTGGWTVELVDATVGSGRTTSAIAIDRLGRVHITYSSGVGGDICRYATKDAGTVLLEIPAAVLAAPVDPPSLTKPASADWAVSLEARQGSRACEPVWLGVAPGPDPVRTMLRSSAAPPPPGGALQLGIAGGDPDDAARIADYRAPGDAREWDLTLDGLRGPGEATLTARAFDLPPDARLWLSDVDAGWIREITPDEPVSFAATGAPKRLRVEVRAANDPPSVQVAGGFRGGYPNPFRAETGLRFVLGRPGDLEVAVFDLAGRHVRQLSRRSATAGEHVLVWDGRGDDGRAVPAGIYLVRFAADGRSGSTRVVKLD